MSGWQRFESDLTRTRTGRRPGTRQDAGREDGRPPKFTQRQQREAIKPLDSGEESLVDIGRNYNVSAATFQGSRCKPLIRCSMSNPYADRRRLTFEQAEGVEPLPTQLQIKEISQQLRAHLWRVVYESIKAATSYPSMGGNGYLREEWESIFYDYHTLREHLAADEFRNDAKFLIGHAKLILTARGYISTFGFLQFVLRHKNCPYQFAGRIDWALRTGYAAYRVLEERTIVPISSEAELETLRCAFANLATTEFRGARSHLHSAGSHLTAGDYASSVRESIHSVESVARTLAPSGQLSEALAKLEKSSVIHGALKKGFLSIYGYTSDEQGIRHPLLDDPQANVDEVDALFMIGACASFVSYMIHKARLSGLLKSKG